MPAQGGRSCVGLKLAYAEARIVLIRLYQRYTFRLTPGQVGALHRPCFAKSVIRYRCMCWLGRCGPGAPCRGNGGGIGSHLQVPLSTKTTITMSPKNGVNVSAFYRETLNVIAQ